MAKVEVVSEMIESENKALVLEAFDTLFNKRDYSRRAFLVARLYSAQRPYRTRPRRPVQSHQEPSANVGVRTGNDRG